MAADTEVKKLFYDFIQSNTNPSLGRGGYGGGRGYGRWDHLNYSPDSHLKTKKQIGAIDPR